MHVIVERFEGEYAIVELPDGSLVSVPKVIFEDAKEGDVVEIIVNQQVTDTKKSDIINRFNSLKQKD